MKFITPLLCALTLSACIADESYLINKKNIGFGIDRLRQSKISLASTSCENVEQFNFTGAVIDNFAPIQDQQNWKGNGQRYWINKSLFDNDPKSPIFVYIGGEGEESCRSITPGLYIYDLAVQHHALLISVEHRFYGESYPTDSMTTNELKYLSSDQSLADLARIVTYLKATHNLQSNPVVSFGGSYPGNLAAWFRLKYPSVTYGSVASSAPLNAKTNFFEYMEVVGQSINYFSGADCYNAFETAANQVSKLTSSGYDSTDMRQFESDFGSCNQIKSDLDLAVFLSNLMGNVQGTIQYNNESPSLMNVTDICAIMLNPSASPYNNFATLSATYRQANGVPCEQASWALTSAYLADPRRDPSNSARPWIYQTCNEFGYFQTTDSLNQPFHSWTQLGLSFYSAICSAAFDGWTAAPQVDWINTKYGGVGIAGTNIIFPSGTADPWHALGQTNATATALQQPTEHPDYILGTAHCKDMYSPKSDDPPELTVARQNIAADVSNWLSTYSL